MATKKVGSKVSSISANATSLAQLGMFIDDRIRMLSDFEEGFEIEVSHLGSHARVATSGKRRILDVYDRAAALAYARKYWRRVSSDSYIGVHTDSENYRSVNSATVFKQVQKNGVVEETAVEPDGTVHSWKDLDDCAHFVSCCIGSPPAGGGGGLTLSRDFPNGPYGVLSADRLYRDLLKRAHIEVVAEKSTDPSDLDKISAGDLIFYWNASLGRYQHGALYMADSLKRISCHTYCRSDQINDYPQRWDSVAGTQSYTFVKVIR
jgi:hypothetical protein